MLKSTELRHHLEKSAACSCAGAIFSVSSWFGSIYKSTPIIADIYSHLCP
jgi:hypothetical protein